MSSLNETFRSLHASGCFVVPNPWDEVSARLLAGAGFEALASTSSGYAFATGRKDGQREVPVDEIIAHAASLSAATGLPVTLDAEDGWADTPEGVAETVRRAAAAGLAGVSIEDRDTSAPGTFRGASEALERVEAAVEAAGESGIVLTARADGLIREAYAVDEAVQRLQAFAKAGADVVYAPALPGLDALRALCASVDKPVNYVLGQGAPGLTYDEIAEAGVRRISLGGSFTRAALDAVAGLARAAKAGDFTAFDTAPGWATL